MVPGNVLQYYMKMRGYAICFGGRYPFIDRMIQVKEQLVRVSKKCGVLGMNEYNMRRNLPRRLIIYDHNMEFKASEGG